MADPLLDVHGVARSFGRNQVLTDASLQVHGGEMVGIVGENGSGKTTLLQILIGRLAAQAGGFRLSGSLGYCPQQPLVFDNLTVAENLAYFATAYGLVDWRNAADDLLSRYHYAAHADVLVSRVSGGTRQKLNLSLALLHDPDLLLLDEPYAGFDWETYLHFWEHAAALRDRGRGLLVVSHILHDRHRFDRVLSLQGGRLVPQ